MVEATQRLSVFSDEDDEPEETREQLAYLETKEAVRYALFDGDNDVGRGPHADVNIDDPTVSHQHAMVEIVAELKAARVRDVGSSNGTFVRDASGDWARLKLKKSFGPVSTGHFIKFGEVELKLVWTGDGNDSDATDCGDGGAAGEAGLTKPENAAPASVSALQAVDATAAPYPTRELRRRAQA